MQFNAKKSVYTVNKFWITCCIGVSIIFATLPTSAHALTIYPIKEEVEISPGTQQELEITLRNDTSFVEIISLRAQAFEAGDVEGVPRFVKNKPHVKWVSLPQKDIVLQAGQSETINFSLTVPRKAEPGGYYLAVFASAKPEGETNTITYTNELGVLYFISVAGDIIRDMKVEDVIVRPNVFGNTHTDVQYTLKNNGTIHELPYGMLTIKNIFSSEHIDIPINAEEARLLPQTTRTLTQSWKPGGIRHSVLNPFRFGIYEVGININNTTDEKTTQRFLIWPPSGLILLIGILSFVFIRYKKKQK